MKKSILVVLAVVAVLAIGYIAFGDSIMASYFPKQYIESAAKQSVKELNKGMPGSNDDYTMNLKAAIDSPKISLDGIISYDKKEDITLLNLSFSYKDSKILSADGLFAKNGIGFAVKDLYDGFYDLDIEVNAPDDMQKEMEKALKELWKDVRVVKKEKSEIEVGGKTVSSREFTLEASAAAMNKYMAAVYAAIGEDLGEIEEITEDVNISVTVADKKIVRLASAGEGTDLIAISATEKRMAEKITISVLVEGEQVELYLNFSEPNAEGKVDFSITMKDNLLPISISGDIVGKDNDLSQYKNEKIESGIPEVGEDKLEALSVKLMPMLYEFYGFSMDY